MPTSNQAKKRMRSDARKYEQNNGVRSKIKTLKKKFNKTASADTVDQDVKVLSKELDKAASKGIIPKNRASRLKSRTAKRANKLKTA